MQLDPTWHYACKPRIGQPEPLRRRHKSGRLFSSRPCAVTFAGRRPEHGCCRNGSATVPRARPSSPTCALWAVARRASGRGALQPKIESNLPCQVGRSEQSSWPSSPSFRTRNLTPPPVRQRRGAATVSCAGRRVSDCLPSSLACAAPLPAAERA